MTKERKIEILMKDRCARKEAERLLKDGTIVYEAEEFEKNFDSYMNERFPQDEYDPEERQEGIEQFRKMVENGTEPEDWSIVEDETGKYYIEYVI